VYTIPYFWHGGTSTPDFYADLAGKASSVSEHLQALVDKSAPVVRVDDTRSAGARR